MYRSSIRFTVRGLFALGCIMAVSASAQAGADNLGTIDVTAERQASPTAASAVPVTVIDRKTIAASHARNVAELLQGRADIVVRDTSGIGVKATVDLGGFGESAPANSLILVDGRRVNSPDLSGVDWNQIPLDQVERIEILHGGGASLYGAGAVGGVINIITRIPEAGGHVGARVGSFGSNGMQASLGMDTGRTRIEGNLSSFNTKGYRVNGGYHRFDGGLRGESDLPAGINLRFSSNYHHDRMGLPASLSAAQVAADRRQSRTPYDFSRTDDSYVDAGLGWHGNSGFGADVDGGVRRRKVHADYVSFTSLSDTVINTQSLRPKLSYDGSLGRVRVQALAGADLQSSTGSWTYSGITPTSFDRFRDGIYGHLHLQGADRRWNLSGGLRSARMHDRFVQGAISAVDNRKTAWDLGASLALAEHVLMRLSMEHSVRFPLLDERFSTFTGTLNTALKPQLGRHVGGSLRYTWDAAWVEASFRRADLSDEIYYDPATFTNANYASGTRHDVWMLTGHWRASDLMQWSASYTYTAAEFRSGSYAGHWIPAVPQHRADLRWAADWTRALHTALNLRYIGDSYLISDQANTHAMLAGYAVADAVVNYRWQDMQMFARVNNLTNRRYSSYGVASAFGSDGYYPAAGISVSAGADYHF